MDLNEHILRKELINLRESSLSDWRSELLNEEEEGEHPYVDVMPSSDEAEQMLKDEKKKKKKGKEKKETEKVEEGYVPLDHEGNEKQTARHLDHARKATKEGGDVDKHMKRAEAVKSPFNRLMQLSAEREKKMEQKRRELYRSKNQ